MQPASRAALAAARERFEQLSTGTSTGTSTSTSTSTEELTRLGTELGAVLAVLSKQTTIRRHLADPSAPVPVRQEMVEALFGGKVSPGTLELLGAVVALRWSRPVDLVDGLEELARQALLVPAERDGSLSDVEDELFRFGRILAAQSRLATLLGDEAVPAQRRLELLDTVLAGRAQPVTRLLLQQAISTPRHRHLEDVVEELVERAADRRERSVAHVRTGGPLSERQEQRLLDVLGRIYQRLISLKVELDPALLGGLVIRVGDEVIDGSIAGRLAKAYQWLPR